MNRHRKWIAVPISAALLCLLPTVRGEFFSDDYRYLLRNETLRGLRLGEVLRVFTTPMPHGEYLPLRDLVLRFEWELFGPNPLGYHLVSLALFAGCLLLIWRLALQITRFGAATDSRSGLVALLTLGLFAAHPAHVETVAWIANQKDLLAGLFVLSSLAACAKGLEADAKGSRYLVLSWILLACGLLSKSVALATPIAAVLIVLIQRRDWRGRARACIRAVLPMVALAALSLAAGIYLYEASHVTIADELPLATRVARSLLIVGFQSRIALFPAKLRLVYDIFDPAQYGPALILGGLTLGAAALATVALWRRRWVTAFGVAWFPVFLLGYLHLKTLKTWSFVAERYLFLPLFGSSLVVAALAAPLLCRSSSPRKRALAATLLVALLATGFGLSGRRALDWESSQTLMAANSRVQAGHHYSLFLELQYLIKKRGDFPAARQAAESVSDPQARRALLLYVEALRLNSAIRSPAQVDKAVQATRELHSACRDMAHATDLTDVPRLVLAWSLLEEGRKLYARLSRLAPENMELAYNRALLEMNIHDNETAAALFKKALDSGAMPRSALGAAWNNLGLALQAQGKLEEAEVAFLTAMRSDSREWRAPLNLLLLPRLTRPGTSRQTLLQELEVRARRAQLEEAEIDRLKAKAAGG